jgi:ABC-type sugar transport system ATPase subunit
MEHITKSFPGVLALNDVQLNVRKGTVHAVMGENGAGKSTLMKVLLGIYKQDSGSVTFKGKVRHFKGPQDAMNNSLAMIHQELSGVRQLTVAQNIFLGKEPTYKNTGLINFKKMRTDTAKLMKELNLNINPDAKMGDLSVSRQQLCEIAKAVSYNADLIVMDEPTSAITESEVELLFAIIRNLLAKKLTIIYITHKMDEVFQICDDISIYRDGTYVGTIATKDTTRDKLIEMMVGREITNMFPKEEVPIGKTLLKVDRLSCGKLFQDVSFKLHRGEILGMAGLIGAGRSEAMETLFGIHKKTSGKVYIKGKRVEINSPQDAINHRMALLTEDRKFNGCFLPLSVQLNITIASVRQLCKGWFVDNKLMHKNAVEMKDAMRIKTPNLEEVINNLSGGNQQKALVGRWLLTNPDILIVDEPTRGIDVGAKSEIHKLLTSLAKDGKGIIMISSELPEVMGMSDRILVMSEGRLTGVLNREEATQEKILHLATLAMEDQKKELTVENSDMEGRG